MTTETAFFVPLVYDSWIVLKGIYVFSSGPPDSDGAGQSPGHYQRRFGAKSPGEGTEKWPLNVALLLLFQERQINPICLVCSTDFDQLPHRFPSGGRLPRCLSRHALGNIRDGEL